MLIDIFRLMDVDVWQMADGKKSEGRVAEGIGTG
jgi:hypothetical protein